MKRVFNLYILLVVLSACASETKLDKVVLSGEIKNSKDSLLILKNNFWEPIDTIQLVNHKFRDTLEIPNSYYFLSNESSEIKIYLTAGMDLKIMFDQEDVVYEGEGQAENNYLASKDKLTNSIPQEKMAYLSYAKLNEKAFLSQTDSIYNLYLSHFESTKGLDDQFTYLEESAIHINNAIRIVDFQAQKRQVENDPLFKVSESYPDPFESVDLNNAILMNTYGYKPMMNSYISALVMNSDSFSASSDFFLLYQKELAKSKLDSEIRDKLGLDDSRYGFTYTQDIEKYYQVYMSFVEIEAYKKLFQQRYNSVRTEAGNPSPEFEFTDIHDKVYSLADFKGKYVYIDLWASWCGPCIKQIPHLKKLEKKYSDKVHFISVAWKDKKEDWKNMLSKQNLQGIQLFAPDLDSEFFNFYDVTGLPRFILLDRDGNIIDSMAKQASEVSLDEQLSVLE